MKETQRLKGALGGEVLRWVPMANWHITLKFFGAVESDLVLDLSHRLARVCLQHRPIELSLARVGFFGSSGNAEILWVGVGGELDALSALSAEIGRECASFAERPDPFAFHPHITLARGRGLDPSDRVVLKNSSPAPLASRFESVVLFRSELSNQGSTYAQIQSFQLGGE